MAQQRICTHGLHLAAAPPSDLAKSIAADSAASARTPVTASCNMVDSSLPHFTLSFLTVECFQSSQMPSHVATHSLPLFPLQRHKEGGERQRERRETERDRERQREERPPRGRGWRGIMSDAVHMLVNVLFFDAISLMLLPFV